jgi:chaperone BCS1
MDENLTNLFDLLRENPFFIGGGAIGVLAALWAMLRGWLANLYFALQSVFITSATFNSEEIVYNALEEWLEQMRFDRAQRRYHINAHIHFSGEYPAEKRELKITLAPEVGAYLLPYRGRILLIHKRKGDKEGGERGGWNGRKAIYRETTIAYLGRDKARLYALLNEVRAIYEGAEPSGRRILVPENGAWSEGSRLPDRPESTIFSPWKGQIMADVERFLKAEARYVAQGIPYHRGYLFHGPPGTGKTSMVHALASRFRLDIFYLPLNNQSRDLEIIRLFQNVIPPAILLLEDIDIVINGRDTKLADGFTLSTLFNVLDGLASKHGLIVAMTTNHVAKLDPALVRPGRIDLAVEFGVCTPDILRQMHAFYEVALPLDEFVRKHDGCSPAEVLQAIRLAQEQTERGAFDLSLQHTAHPNGRAAP